MALRLVTLVGPSPGTFLELAPGRHVLGRAPRCADLVVDHPGVSRAHVELVVLDGLCRVRDLGTANGTRVGDRPLGDAPMPLHPGEELVLAGCVRLRLEEPGAPPDEVLDGVHACVRCGRALHLSTFAEGQVRERSGRFECPSCAGTLEQVSADLVRGFHLLGLLGTGGMGTVFRARRLGDGRLVALKVLQADLGEDPTAAGRFLRELESLSRLRHPHVVGLQGAGVDRGRCYLVLDLVEGPTLATVVREGHPLALVRALRLVRQVALALDSAADHGVVHRDVKPENVLVSQGDHAWLLDFGLARALDAAGLTGLTGSGEVLGSVHYMAPEQVEAPSRADHRSDVYALGATLYHALTGTVPFRREGAWAILHAVQTEPLEPPSAHRDGLPQAVEAIVVAAMERDPARRTPSTRAMGRALEVALASLEG